MNMKIHEMKLNFFLQFVKYCDGRQLLLQHHGPHNDREVTNVAHIKRNAHKILINC